MVSAPPHAKSKTRNKRSRRTDFIKCLYGFPVIPAVSKGIVILGIFISCNKIALFVNEHCFAVIKKISTVFCNKTVIGVRITYLTSRLIRVESGAFTDQASYTVWFRNFDEGNMEVSQSGSKICCADSFACDEVITLLYPSFIISFSQNLTIWVPHFYRRLGYQDAGSFFPFCNDLEIIFTKKLSDD